MLDRDVIQGFVFEDHDVRGHIIHLNASFMEVLKRHAYPEFVRNILGETLAATTLLSATVKVGGLHLQVQGEGPLTLLLAQANNRFNLRGLAKWEGDVKSDFLPEAMGKAQLVITMDPGPGSERYQGIVDVSKPRIASAIEDYFLQSEQLPTRLWLACGPTCAAGLLLQRLPGTQVDEDFWHHAVHLASTISAEELLNLPNEELLFRLYHEDQVRLFDPEPVNFRCNCSIDRMESAIRMLPPEEIAELKLLPKMTVTCEFCNKDYDLDSIDLARILANDGFMPPTSSDKN